MIDALSGGAPNGGFFGYQGQQRFAAQNNLKEAKPAGMLCLPINCGPPTKKAPSGADAPKKPMRPLTAYHIFFQIEREYIIQTLEGDEEVDKSIVSGKDFMEDVPQRYKNIKLAPDWFASPGKRQKRKHRKSHGKIGFLELSRQISARWAELDKIDPETKAFVKALAHSELTQYQKEMSDYRELSKKLSPLEAPKSSPALPVLPLPVPSSDLAEPLPFRCQSNSSSFSFQNQTQLPLPGSVSREPRQTQPRQRQPDLQPMFSELATANLPDLVGSSSSVDLQAEVEYFLSCIEQDEKQNQLKIQQQLHLQQQQLMERNDDMLNYMSQMRNNKRPRDIQALYEQQLRRQEELRHQVGWLGLDRGDHPNKKAKKSDQVDIGDDDILRLWAS